MSESITAYGDPSLEGYQAPWLSHLIVLAALLCALGALFFRDVRAAVEVWWIYPAYSHCFLIIPITAWLIWENRASLRTERPEACPTLLLAGIPIVLLWLIGSFASITEIRQVAIIGFAEILIMAVLGWNIFRKISFACLFLFFLIPTGQYLIPGLQLVTAKFVEYGLNILSIPHFRDGLVFELVNGNYEIAEACAGLRFLVATITLGVLFCHMVFRNPVKIVAFLSACLVVPIIGNGLRALLTVIVANFTDNKVAAGFDHLVYGWVFAVAIILLLLFFGSQFRDDEAEVAAPLPASIPLARREDFGRLVVATLGGCLLLGAAPAAAHWVDSAHHTVEQSAVAMLLKSYGWQISSGGDWKIDFSSANAQAIARRTFEGGQAPVDLDINYYLRDRTAPSLLASRNHAWQKDVWHPVKQGSVKANLGGVTTSVDETVIESSNLQRVVWTIYWVDGQFTTKPLSIRLMEFEAGLMHKNAAVLAFSTPITSNLSDAHARLNAATMSLQALSPQLNRLDHTSALVN